MYIPFEALPATSRVWIFQASRPMRADEIRLAERKLRAFTDEWVVHGSPLDTSYAIRHSQFIILAADESSQAASGCSIDSSVRVLKDLEALLQLDLFDRSHIALLSDGKVLLYPLKDLKEKFKAGTLTESTLTFNNLVNTKGQLDTSWLVAAGETWLARYIPNALAKEK